MSTIEIDKNGGYVVVTNGDIKTRTSIKLADCVVSVPPPTFKKVLNIYINPSTMGLVITYEA